jgi:hypothetical protein
VTLDKILQPVITAAVLGCAAMLWQQDKRLDRIEYALGIQEIVPNKRIADNERLAQKATE